MYAREVQGEVHTFGVSGKLIMNALVMYDHQTRTLWSQFLGKGVKGSLAGTELDFLPVTQTTWTSWRELHPDTLVLNKDGRYSRDSYESYYRGGAAGVLGETNRDGRLKRKELVLGVSLDGVTKAYPFRLLDEQPIVNDSINGRDVLVFFDKSSGTALAYEAMVDGRALTFRMEGDGRGPLAILVDDQTGSTWMAFTGRAVDGELKGMTVDRVTSHLSFWFAWSDWNPDTQLYSG